MKKVKLSAREREALLWLLIEKYKADPLTIENILPEAAQILGSHFGNLSGRSDFSMPCLTLSEEAERCYSYRKLIENMRSDRTSFSKEKAIKALEDAAALMECSLKPRLELKPKDIKTLIKIASRLSLSKKGKVREWVLRDGTLARSVNLLRGVKVHLTWDKKLLSIKVDPKGLRLRDEALKFVGIAKDEAINIAECHDQYLAVEGFSE